jgi:hypothetical protein
VLRGPEGGARELARPPGSVLRRPLTHQRGGVLSAHRIPVRAEAAATFNSRFGADLSDNDAIRTVQHLIDKTAEIGEAHGLQAQAIGNTLEDFERGKEGVLLSATLQVKDINDLILQKFLDDESVRKQMTHLVMQSLHDRYNGDAAAA